MIASSLPHPFVVSLSKLRFQHCFNPYSEACEVYDRKDAAERRSSTLSALMHLASSHQIDAIWIGRDLGHRGGRRTGLALTDDIHIENHCQRWNYVAQRPTKGAVLGERTAATIWKLLDRIESKIFLWNVFPLHPHEPGQPFTNRQHNSAERQAGENILEMLLEILRPRMIVAIGNDAAVSAERVASPSKITGVRHPSYGGQRQFVEQIAAIYSLRATTLI